MPSTALINLTVTSFVENTSTSNPPTGSFCAVNAPSIQDNGNGQVGIDPSDANTIWVNGTPGKGGQPVTLQFTLISSPPTPRGFALVALGVVFNLTRPPSGVTFPGQGPAPAQNGSNNFNTISPTNPVSAVISFKDIYASHGNRGSGTNPSNASPRWKFYIQVRDTVSDKVGWIDPGIENSDDM